MRVVTVRCSAVLWQRGDEAAAAAAAWHPSRVDCECSEVSEWIALQLPANLASAPLCSRVVCVAVCSAVVSPPVLRCAAVVLPVSAARLRRDTTAREVQCSDQKNEQGKRTHINERWTTAIRNEH